MSNMLSKVLRCADGSIFHWALLFHLNIWDALQQGKKATSKHCNYLISDSCLSFCFNLWYIWSTMDISCMMQSTSICFLYFQYVARRTNSYRTMHHTNTNSNHAFYVTPSIVLCLSLNFKQLLLYYASVVFLLERCCQGTTSHIFFKFATTIILTITVLWPPYYYFNSNDSNVQYFMHIDHWIFTFHWGLFANIVANLWYALPTQHVSAFLREIN